MEKLDSRPEDEGLCDEELVAEAEELLGEEAKGNAESWRRFRARPDVQALLRKAPRESADAVGGVPAKVRRRDRGKRPVTSD